MCPYNQNIPQPADQLRDSQGDLLANFQDIFTLVGVNHAIFGNPNQGKHKWVSFPEEAVGPATLIDEMALYTKQSALSGVAELFVRRENNGTEIEFTSALIAANGWTRLPSGVLLKWGHSAANGLATTVFPVAANIPVFANIRSLLLSPFAGDAGDTDHAIRAQIVTVLNFNAYGSFRTIVGANLVQFRYLAIGD